MADAGSFRDWKNQIASSRNESKNLSSDLHHPKEEVMPFSSSRITYGFTSWGKKASANPTHRLSSTALDYPGRKF